MSTPSQKLADSLEVLQQLQANGVIAIKSSDISRTHRERLIRNGFLEDVIKGWYIPARPDGTKGDSTAWYASFWAFCAAYLNELKGKDWCVSPEQSIALHVENWTVPKQLLVRTRKSRNNITNLPHSTSLLDVRANLPKKENISVINNVRVFSLPSALCACGPQIFVHSPIMMRSALSMITDSSDVLNLLLDGGQSIVAGRLAGAFRNIGRDTIADNITATMRAANYTIRESDPFERKSTLMFASHEQSPYVNRIRLMWQDMRQTVIEHFPAPPTQPTDTKKYMKHVEEVYVNDAYNSLSIEGYRVQPELIERVRIGQWDPEKNADDKEHQSALAARGYWQVYQVVCKSIRNVLKGGNAGNIVKKDHHSWYRDMYAPSVTAGILKATDLAGYRNGAVYIRKSKHVPPSKEAVRDAMPAFFDLLKDEKDAAVRVVLGHFIFVYIHPYMDGNGRIGRFLMNTMLASGGYPWTVVPLKKRNEYMAALEKASTMQNIKPFSKFLGALVLKELNRK